MDRFVARKAVKEAMADLGLDRGTEDHEMAVGRSQRSGAIVEPMISTQWFVRMKPLAEPAIAAVEEGRTRFVPAKWENTYFSWMREIRDWCISRQLWWGHQIPAWYCGDCEHITVTREDPTQCGDCGSEGIERDPDVLDTWFSSALWPFSTLGWPEDTPDLKTWYPTSVLVTGFDIIFFWVARMIFSGLHHMGEVPFSDVFIHGLVRDSNGEKMSKTKGNVVDPLHAIGAHGCDAFRFTMAQYATQGRDILWDDNRVEINARFVNKIWQAFRYVDMNLEGYEAGTPGEPGPYDHWVRVRCGRAVSRVRDALEGYRFNEAAGELHAFVWGEFCDWYLEFSKQAIYGEGREKAAAQATLVATLGDIARLMHPIMPFLSEEIWQRLPGRDGDESVMRAAFPRPEDYPEDEAVLVEVALLQEAISAIRRVRADMGLSPRLPLPVLLRGEGAETLLRHSGALAHLAGVDSAAIHVGEAPQGCATVVVRGLRLLIPLEGVVDVASECERLDKELGRVGKDVADLEKRLGNRGFVDKAPQKVVEDFRVKLTAARDKLAQLHEAREALS